MARPTEADRRRIEARRTDVAEQWLRCVPLKAIAARHGVDPAQITRDLQTIRKEWAKARPEQFQIRVLDELARIDQLECAAWAGYERSCEDAVIETAKKVKTEDGERSEAAKRTHGQAGDPRFLERVGWCINRRIELLGLDAPKQLAISGKVIVDHDLKGLSPDAIRSLILLRRGPSSANGKTA